MTSKWLGRVRGALARRCCRFVVDADHFKRCDDRQEHAVSDHMQKGLARRLPASVPRPDARVARADSEAFAILLSGTAGTKTLRIAAEVHEAATTLSVAPSGIASGTVTVDVALTAETGARYRL